MLRKNRTFSSTNWENEHYFETLSALTLNIGTALILSVENDCLRTGICVRSATSEAKSTLIMTASPTDISVDLRGSLTAHKEHACFCRFT